MAARNTTTKVRGRNSGGLKSFRILSSKRKESVTLLGQVETFSKLITKAYLIIWIEVILFSQAMTLMSFGDALSIQYIFSNVTELGRYVFAFYFSTKALENIFKGVEDHLTSKTAAAESAPAVTPENADADTTPVE